MFATTDNDITFYYKKDVLFNDVSLMSSYMSKNLSTKDGNSLTDDYAISDDEHDLVDVCVRATLPDIYEAMVKITTAVSSAFDDDATVSGDKCVVFKMQNNKSYNSNVLTMLDSSIYNCIKHGTLKEVYSTIVNPEFYNSAASRFVAELYKLKQRLFQLKKKTVETSLS